jgi:hypothetical protein
VWRVITKLFASQPRTRINHLRGALNNTKKNELSAPAYFAKMKSICSEHAAVGKPSLADESLATSSTASIAHTPASPMPSMPTSTTSLLITYTECFALMISARICFIVLARELLLSPPRPTLASVAVTLIHMVVTMDVMTAVTIVVISMVEVVVMMVVVVATMMVVIAAMMMMAGAAATMMMVVIVVTMMMLAVATVMIVMVADASVMMCVARRTFVAEMMGAVDVAIRLPLLSTSPNMQDP